MTINGSVVVEKNILVRDFYGFIYYRKCWVINEVNGVGGEKEGEANHCCETFSFS